MLQLDAGNLSDNPTPEGDMRTHALIEGMNRLGYSVANVGERDMALGYEEFVKRTGDAEFPFISANIVNRETREPVFKPYVILEVEIPSSDKNVRVGVLGVVRFNPVFLKDGPDGSKLMIIPPLEAVNKYLGEIRENADVVVVMGALHGDDAHIIAREAPGIDVFLGTYGATYTTREETEGDTVISYAGNQGRRIGETRLYLDPEGEVERTVSYMHNLGAAYPANAEMQDYVLEQLREIGKLKAAREGKPAESPGAAEAETTGAS